jgi:hypothetical protein
VDLLFLIKTGLSTRQIYFTVGVYPATKRTKGASWKFSLKNIRGCKRAFPALVKLIDRPYILPLVTVSLLDSICLSSDRNSKGIHMRLKSLFLETGRTGYWTHQIHNTPRSPSRVNSYKVGKSEKHYKR